MRYRPLCAFTVLFVARTVIATFNPLHHSGPASPYFNAPSRFNVSSQLPAGCVVEKAAYIIRHGARYPEPGSYQGWVNLFSKLQNSTYNATGSLDWLPSWTLPVDDVPHQPLYLTSHGAAEAFTLGMQLRGRYKMTKGGDNFTVWSAGQQRVVDTATYFLRGYLSQGNYLNSTSENRGAVYFMPDSVNSTGADSLTASAACPLYSGEDGSNTSTAYRALYQPAIAERLNKQLQGLTLNTTDIGVMQDLCGFGFVINGDMRFCEIFSEEDWLNYEYAGDLNYYYGRVIRVSCNTLAGTTAYPWLKAVTQLLASNSTTSTSDATFIPPPLIISTTHDNDIPPVIAALGILNSSSIDPSIYPLSPTTPNPNRTFFSSNMVNFLGHVALERLSCEMPLKSPVQHVMNVLNAVPGTGPNAQEFVRVLVNNAVVPLPTCQGGPGASCSLSDFVQYVEQRGTILGDFVQKCGLSNVTNIPDIVDFYSDPLSPGAQASLLELPVL